MEGWPGWVGLGGLVEHQDSIPHEWSPISVLNQLDVDVPRNDFTTKPNRPTFYDPHISQPPDFQDISCLQTFYFVPVYKYIYGNKH